MPTLISRPSIVAAAGTKPKQIEEFVGRVNSGTSAVSVARMTSPGGWVEPGQTPEFDEYTLVLRGCCGSRPGRRGGRPRRPGGHHAPRRVGAIQHAGGRGGAVRCGLCAGVLAGDGQEGRLSPRSRRRRLEDVSCPPIQLVGSADPAELDLAAFPGQATIRIRSVKLLITKDLVLGVETSGAVASNSHTDGSSLVCSFEGRHRRRRVRNSSNACLAGRRSRSAIQ